MAILASTGKVGPVGAVLFGGLAVLGAALTTIVAGGRLRHVAHPVLG